MPGNTHPTTPHPSTIKETTHVHPAPVGGHAPGIWWVKGVRKGRWGTVEGKGKEVGEAAKLFSIWREGRKAGVGFHCRFQVG